MIDLYSIQNEYIKYLKKYDTRVMNNTDPLYKKNRPYVGIITQIGSHDYFIPLSSKDKKVNKKVSTIIRRDDGSFIGTIKYNNMIPVQKMDVSLIKSSDFSNDQAYMRLILLQKKYIKENENVIISKAKSVYTKSIENKLGPLEKICCDFKLLENKCIEYNKLENKKTPKIKMT